MNPMLLQRSGIKICESYNRQYGRDYRSVAHQLTCTDLVIIIIQKTVMVPALIRRFHEAKENLDQVVVWGSGRPKREFLYVDDMARQVSLCTDLIEVNF